MTQLEAGAAAGPWAGRLFDGETPIGVPATVWVTAGGLEFQLAAGERRTWPFEEIRIGDSGFGDAPRFERGEPLPQTLIVEDRAILASMRAAGGAQGKRFHRASGARRLRTIGLIAVAALAAILIGLYAFAIPALSRAAAERVPIAWEEKAGAEMIGRLAPESRRLDDPRLTAALDRIRARLESGLPDHRYHFHVFAIDDQEVNAFASPGGNIVVLRGLLETVGSAEELAAVLAHEMQHVVLRHSLQSILQHLSMGLLTKLVLGDQSGSLNGVEMARSLGELSYSRRAEIEADAGAVRQLRAARIDPEAALEFMHRLDARSGARGGLAFLSTHPGTDQRLALIRRRIDELPAGPNEPILDRSEWTAIVDRIKQSPARSAEN